MKTKIEDFKKEKDQTLIMLIGISGSGKSFYLKNKILKDLLFINDILIDNNISLKDIIVCPDDIRREVTGNVSDISNDYKVWLIVKERTNKKLKYYGISILDATNVYGKGRKDFLDNFNLQKKIAIVFKPDRKLSKDRISNDILNKVDRSNVPEEAIERQFNRYKSGVVGDDKWKGEWNYDVKNKIINNLSEQFDEILFSD